MILKISRVAVLGLLVTVGSLEKTAAQSTNAPSAGPTYSKDVAPILFKNCTSCHRPGKLRRCRSSHTRTSGRGFGRLSLE
jgi:hypothetical protein